MRRREFLGHAGLSTAALRLAASAGAARAVAVLEGTYDPEKRPLTGGKRKRK